MDKHDYQQLGGDLAASLEVEDLIDSSEVERVAEYISDWFEFGVHRIIGGIHLHQRLEWVDQPHDAETDARLMERLPEAVLGPTH
jgi:hypothetical protein